MTIEQWRAGTLTFLSDVEYGNPFLDVQIQAVFTGPSGQQISREAYWDGGNTYCVSFAPTQQGEWKYTLSCSDASNGLHGQSGSVICVEYSGGLNIYRHGFLKVGEQGNHLAHSDGTPFFWLGDTHWGFVSGESWEESNHPRMESQFKGMVDRRVRQGFTVYQTNLRPEFLPMNEGYWAEGPHGLLPNVSFYQETVDPRMEYIADGGLVNALGLAWSGAILDQPELYRHFARYIVARYGALPVVWTLAGEVAGYAGATRQQCIDGWREIALLVERLDGYGNLQTAHYTNERPFADYYQEEAWFDFTLNQAGHGDYPISPRHFREHRSKYPAKPFIEGESLYEGVSTLEELGSRMADAAMLRRVAYMSIQLGGCGYTYGAQGIWDTVWDKDSIQPYNVFNAFGRTWIDGIDAEGGDQMGYMRQFYEACRFEKLHPVPGCFHTALPFSDETLSDLFGPLISADEGMSTIVIYFPPAYRSSGGAYIQGLPNKRYAAKWFDPRSGVYTEIGSGIEPEEGRWTPPHKPSPGDWDWLLILTQL